MMCCFDLVIFVLGGTLQVSIVGALPSGTATLDGGPGLFGTEVERREWNGRDQVEFRCGFLGHGGFSYQWSVIGGQ